MKKIILIILAMSIYTQSYLQIGFHEHIVIDKSSFAKNPLSVQSCDIDGDGDLDILSASEDNKITWFENKDGKGEFVIHQIIITTENPKSVSAADVDGDGDLDVISANNGVIVWFENTNGLGRFSAPIIIPTTTTLGVSIVHASDLDGDNDMDILFTASDVDNQLQWLENIDGQGDFSNLRDIETTSNSITHIYTSDIDNDGDEDVISSSYDDDKITWFENIDGLGNFGDEQIINGDADGASSVYTSDLDGDGDEDVLSSTNNGRLAWYENMDGQGSFGDVQIINEYEWNCYSVSAADIDGDGDMDIISSSSFGEYRISWYENTNGQGDFGVQQIITTKVIGDLYATAADLDGDGDLDVFSSSKEDDKIAWYENTNGQGSFGGQKIMTPSVNYPRSVDYSDLDGDGDMDLLSASFGDDKIAWYENMDGKGTFGKQKIITEEAKEATSVFSSDIDGDGDMDVLSATRGSIVWYENINGLGSFGAKRFVSSLALFSTSVFSSDIDGDGDMDVLSAYGGTIIWYENLDGQGDFDFNLGSHHYITGSANVASSVFSADLDGDGYVDVLSASKGDDKIAWYRNLDGNGNFGEQQIITTDAIEARSVYASDIDGDGDLDVLTASGSYVDDVNRIAWHENTDGQGNFGEQQIITSDIKEARSAYATDLDGDGDMDVLFGSNVLGWHENTDGKGNFGEQQIITSTSTAYAAKSVIATDIDSDGDMDVMSASYDNKIAWYENTGGQSNYKFGAQQIITTDARSPTSIFVSDMDGDDDSDVLSTSYDDDKIAWYANTDGKGNFGEQQIINTEKGARSIQAADINDDGYCDIIYSAHKFTNDETIVWHENINGTGNFGDKQVVSEDNGPITIVASDIDTDGDIDIVTFSKTDSSIVQYENLTGILSTSKELITNIIRITAIHITDLDGDGDMDILTASEYINNLIGWYENLDGHGNFGRQHIISKDISIGIKLFPEDIDGDGDMDILATSSGDRKIRYFKNIDGNGKFSNGQEYFLTIDGETPRSIHGSDLDNDGDIDILAGISSDDVDGDKIVWFENTNGSGVYGKEQIITTKVKGNKLIVSSADINGNGKIDVLSANSTDNKIAWYKNLGVDTENPIAACKNATVYLNEDGTIVLEPSAVDDGSSDDTSIESYNLSVDYFDCSNVGTNEVVLIVTDGVGNSDSCTATVTVIDTLAPIPYIDNLADINAECELSDLPIPVATDNCLGSINGTHNAILPITSQGTTIVGWTYDDGNGNISIQAQNIIIEDLIDPMVVTKDINIDLNGASSQSILPNQIDDGSTDNCEILTLSLDIDTFTEIGAYTVTLTAEDNNNNSSSGTSLVTVLDSTTGIQQERDVKSILLYPNPTFKFLYIKSNNEIIKSVMLYSVVGEKVIETSRYSIDVSELSAGPYIVKIVTENGKMATKKMIKF